MTSAAAALNYGHMIREGRARKKVTVLRRPSCNWGSGKAADIFAPLGTDIVCQNQEHPHVILLLGEFTRDQVTTALRSDDFGYEVLQGWDHPTLPFYISA